MAGTPNPLDAMTWEERFIYAAFEFMKLQSRVAKLEEELKLRNESTAGVAAKLHVQRKQIRDLTKKLGEPPLRFETRIGNSIALQSDVAKKVRRLRHSGMSYDRIGKELGIPVGTARYYTSGR